MASSHRLPEELIRPATPRRVALHVVGTLAVVLGLNVAALAYMRREPLSYDAAMSHAKWSLLRAPAGGVDTLIVGDSSGNFGVVPVVLEEELGWRAINVCTMGRFLAVGDVWMVQDWIERNGPPARVISVHAVRRWEDRLRASSIAQVPLPYGFWDRVPDLDLGWEERRDLMLARYLPLYAASVSLSRAVRAWTWKIESPIPISPRGHSSLLEAKPANVLHKAGQTRAELAERRELALTGHNRTALEALVELADDHGFDLYLAHGPAFRGLSRAPVYERYLGWLNAYLSDLAGRSPRVRTVFAQPLDYAADQMENPNHLVGEHAQAFSRSLAEALAGLQLGDGAGDEDQ